MVRRCTTSSLSQCFTRNHPTQISSSRTQLNKYGHHKFLICHFTKLYGQSKQCREKEWQKGKGKSGIVVGGKVGRFTLPYWEIAVVTILTILTVGGYSGAEQTLRPVPWQRVPNGLLYRRVQVRIVDSKANAIDFNFYSGCYFTFIMIENICQNAQNKCYFYIDLVLGIPRPPDIFVWIFIFFAGKMHLQCAARPVKG